MSELRATVAMIVSWALVPASVEAQIPWPVGPGDALRDVGIGYAQYLDVQLPPYPHDGIDIRESWGYGVYAVADGYIVGIIDGSPDSKSSGYVIADSLSGQEGYVYQHLEPISMSLPLLSEVKRGQYLGWVVDFTGFQHLHFCRVRGFGEPPWSSWASVENPLLLLRPNRTTERAEIVDADKATGRAFYFFENETSTELDPTALSGKVDIVARIEDTFNPSGSAEPWKVVPLAVWLAIVPTTAEAPVSLKLSFLARGKLEAPGAAEPAHEYVNVLYNRSRPALSRGGFDKQEFYFIVTNTDGDGVVEPTDRQECWDTTRIENGDYVVCVMALGLNLEVVTRSMKVSVQNESE